MPLNDATNKTAEPPTAPAKASVPCDPVQLTRSFFANGSKAAEWMNANCSDDFTIHFGEVALPLAPMSVATAACIAACPDLNYNATEPKQIDAHTAECVLTVTGTHTGADFSPMPSLPAIAATGVHCQNDPEHVVLSFNDRGQLAKCVVTVTEGGKLGARPRGFSGPPGFYQQMQKSAATAKVLDTSPVLQVLLPGHTDNVPAAGEVEGLNHARPICSDSNGSGSVLFWRDQASMQRFNQSNESNSREFRIMKNVTRKSFDALPGRSFSDARAVLVINGTAAEGLLLPALVAKFDGEMAEVAGKTYGSIPGVIAKVFLEGTSANVERVIGGCYLFESEQAADDYIEGEVWGAVKDDTAMWHSVTTQKFAAVPRRCTPEIARFVGDYVACEEGLGSGWSKAKQRFYREQFYEPDAVLIRPSGNPLTLDGMQQMFASGVLKGFSNQLVSLDSCKVIAGGAAAVVTYTARQKFSYNGTDNDDLVKFSLVLHRKSSEGKATVVPADTYRS